MADVDMASRKFDRGRLSVVGQISLTVWMVWQRQQFWHLLASILLSGNSVCVGSVDDVRGIWFYLCATRECEWDYAWNFFGISGIMHNFTISVDLWYVTFVKEVKIGRPKNFRNLLNYHVIIGLNVDL